jgi:hypothetical protein
VLEVVPGATVTSTRQAVNNHMLAQSLTHRPDTYTTQTFQMSFAPVSAT